MRLKAKAGQEPAGTKTDIVTKPARPQPRSNRTSSQSRVVAHRLFPGLAALWFAALFGLGTLAASADALASLVLHLHLPAILPAAAPPLGLTARLLVALGLAGLGGAFGLMLGLSLYVRAGGAPLFTARAKPTKAVPEPRAAAEGSSQAPRVRSRDAHPDAPTRRPLVVTEDVLPYHTPAADAVAEGAPALIEGALIESDAPQASRPTVVPPAWIAAELSHDEPEDAGDALGYDAVDAPFGSFAGSASAAQTDHLPPFLAAALAATHASAEPFAFTPADPIIIPAEPEILPAETLVTEPEGEAVPHAEAPAIPAPLASQAAAAPHVPIAEAPVASLGLVQLIERLALAIAARQARHAALAAHVGPDSDDTHGDLAMPIADVVDPRMPLHRFDPLTMDPTGPLLRAKPARLGRIGNSFGEAGSDHAVEDHAVEDGYPVKGGAPCAEVGPGAQLHDPLAQVGHAAHDWVDAIDHDLPPRFLGGLADSSHADTGPLHATHDEGMEGDEAEADDSAEVGGEGDVVESRYSSLVNMAIPRPELVPSVAPVRHADERDVTDESGPVVHFPFAPTRLPVGDAAPEAAGDETVHADRALRDALATLRRMTAQR